MTDRFRTLGSVRTVRLFVWTALSGVLLAGTIAAMPSCASPAFNDSFGVTTGGQQDIASARAVIESGGVPDPASITVQGFLSEHSIPIDAPENPGLLFAAVSASWNMDFDAFTPLATVQIGFGSTIDPETFTRDALNLAIVIDKSGSMDDPIDQRTSATKMGAVLVAIDRLLGNLNSTDLVSVVAFDTKTSVLVDAAQGDDVVTIKNGLDGLEAKGGTDLARGIRRGFTTVQKHTGPQRSDRVFLFTDILPTVGTNETDDFIAILEDFADDGIGATVFGVGVDFGDELAFDISQVRGGNFFFLSDYDRIITVFDEEFDLLVTPVAYDVQLTMSIPFSMDVDDVYGIPLPEELSHVVELAVPTLFLSSRAGGGAIFVRQRAGSMFDFEVENNIADILLSYTTPDGEIVSQPPLSAILPAGLDAAADQVYFETDGIKRGVLLLNTALVLKAASEDAFSIYGYFDGGQDPARAVERLTEFLPYFDELAEGLDDKTSDSSRSLSEERALVAKLLSNIQGF